MKHGTKWLDTSEELHIFRSGNGIRLIRPDRKRKHLYLLHDTGETVGGLLQFPCNIYFLDRNSTLQNINERTTINCGFNSVRDAIGRTIRDVADKRSAEMLISNDKIVVTQNKIHISDDNYLSKQHTNHTAISMKFPLYKNNQVIGILGCSVVVGKQSLSDSLNKITSLGLLSKPRTIHTILPGTKINDTYLSKRETEIINLLVHGKTAKDAAIALNLSKRTVENYLANIKSKLNINSKSELIEKLIPYFL
ncbi:MAG: putative transcriptional regulator [uncultured bacterium]|nr:MAG: putative transcriptional regulator [uncultured bacterium]